MKRLTLPIRRDHPVAEPDELLPGTGKPLRAASRNEIEMAASWYQARSDDLAAKARRLYEYLKAKKGCKKE